MGLKQIAATTISSAQASVTLSGIDTSDVYMAVLSDVKIATDNKNVIIQTTTGGSADSDSDLDGASQQIDANTSFSMSAHENASSFTFAHSCGNAAGEGVSAIFYLYFFNNTSEHSMAVYDSVWNQLTPRLKGMHAGFTKTANEANDGLHFTVESSTNFTAGTFALYQLES